MDNNFRVSVSAVFNKIDSSYIDRWQKQKGAIKIPIKLEGTMSQDDMKKRINEVKNSFGKISTSFDPLEPSKIQKVTLAYKDRLDTVKEVWRYNSEINALELKSVNTTSSGVNLEKQITKEIEKQVKLTNSLMDKSRMKQAGLNSKFESGQYTPESMVSARKLSSQLQSTMAASGNIRPENLDKYNAAVKRLHTEIGIAEKGFVRVNKEQISFGDSLKSKISSLLQYASASALLFGALQQLQQGVQYIKELNKAMTDIQLVTGMSAENIGDLTFKFSDFAKEMGATTLEVAEGSLQFYRQGKSAEDTAKLIKTSMMMSKLANIEAAQSTEYLTSIMNGFQLEAEETTEVLDKLVAIDNSSATSVAELAEAMQRSSSVAQQSGVDFNNLAAYIGTVSSVTRRSASTIGEAFPERVRGVLV